MTKYTKQPIVIEAIQYINERSLIDIIEMVGSDKVISGNNSLYITGANCRNVEIINGELKISTLEGVMVAKKGDYIIRGVKGEIYPCKPDIFQETYKKREKTHNKLNLAIDSLRDIVASDKLIGAELREASFVMLRMLEQARIDGVKI